MKRLLVLAGAVAIGLWVAATAAEAQAGPEGGSITAVRSGGTLTVTGTADGDTITVTRDGLGTILVNGGAVAVTGGPATTTNTSVIVVRGLGGFDNIDADDSAGPMPQTELYGGGDIDLLSGSNGIDLLDGGPGNDSMNADSGVDEVRGGTGDDTFRWPGSDGNDTLVGGAGVDLAAFGLSNQADDLTLTAGAGGRVTGFYDNLGTTATLDQIETAEVTGRAMGDTLTVRPLATTDLREITFVGSEGPNSSDGESDVLRLFGDATADRFRLAASTAALAPPPAPTTTVRLPVASLDPTLDQVLVRLNGGADTFNGAGFGTGLAATFLFGGPGNDTITGTGSADQFRLAAADGSDVLDGRGGIDSYGSDGVPANETISFTASGIRTLVKRNTATSDLRRIEELALAGQAGADNVTVHNLAGTPVTDVHVDLRTVGPDGVADTVAVDGSGSDDALSVVDGPSGTASVTGAVVPVSIEGLDESTVRDRIRLNGLGGGDVLRGGAVVVPVTLAGGTGADDLAGGTRTDRLLGGPGADLLAWGGTFADTVDGGPSADRLRVDGTGAAEDFGVARTGSRVHVTRDINTIDLSIGTVERIDLRVVSGADNVTVGDLSGTGLSRLDVLLQSTFAGTSPDGALDEITLTGRSGVDMVTIGPDGPGVRVTGLVPLLVLRNADPTDRLVVAGAGNADRINATTLPAGRVLLRLLGGPGNDVLRGSPGNDDFDGGIGTDTVMGGAGTDTQVNGENVTGVP